MMSSRDLESLLAWKAPQGHSILSLYLDRKAAQGLWSSADCRPVIKDILKDLEGRVSEEEREEFEAASQNVLSRLTSGPWSGRSLAAFSGPNGDSYWSRQLNVPVHSKAQWAPTPFVRPLLEAIEEYERYGAVLVDKMRARLFTVFLGEIEEERDAFNPEPVKHASSTGTDQIRTDPQRRAEEHARRHLRHVAAMIDRLERARRFDRLILGGAPEAVHELRHLLSKRLVSRTVGLVHLSVEAPDSEVLRETLELERQTQRARQEERVEELTTAAAKADRAVLGLSATLDALRQQRIWKLVYAEDLAVRGRECACGGLFEESVTQCPLCEEEARPVEDLVEKMAERVADEGGRVEPVSNGAAERFREHGGIGAFLWF
jgi:peptide chain release factor subunit 1